ncbi:MAG: metallophosphoesterase family protein [Rubrimonas sp.]|uniref:metallophosphoesterase family protein n=1 Tax=Rubrimonas sp. TaxID=2036015 RepID=UPI002FDDE903
MSVRIAIVADIHHGRPSATKRGDRALALMESFAAFADDARPDLVLDLGDRISDEDAETDARLAAEAADAFRAVTAPRAHLDGNHDRDHLSAAQNDALLGREGGSETLDIGGWRIALWRADPKIHRGNGAGRRGFALPEPDLLWLSRVAQAADRPLLVVSHVPVSGHAQTGNYYFERNPSASTYPEAARARAALAQARVPVLCLAGHVHWNTVTTVDGIAHLTQQSLTESFTTEGEAAGAMGLLELGDGVARWRVEGLDPFEATLRPTARRWTPPLPPFDTVRGLRPETDPEAAA